MNKILEQLTKPRRYADIVSPLVIVEDCGCKVYYRQTGVDVCARHAENDVLRVKEPALFLTGDEIDLPL